MQAFIDRVVDSSAAASGPGATWAERPAIALRTPCDQITGPSRTRQTLITETRHMRKKTAAALEWDRSWWRRRNAERAAKAAEGQAHDIQRNAREVQRMERSARQKIRFEDDDPCS